MRKIFISAWLILLIAHTAFAAKWPLPTEKDYYSENGRFKAHVTPATTAANAALEVSKIKGSKTKPLWSCTLPNEIGPRDVFVAPNGKYVVAVDDVTNEYRQGMGDYVLAFYNKKGLIKNYSLEQIFHYPEKLARNLFRRTFRLSIAGRRWTDRPVFFDTYKRKLYFCAWHITEGGWLAWRVSTGKEVEVTDKMRKRWTEKGRKWARDHGVKSEHWKITLQFLEQVHKHSDRKIVESFLKDPAFRTGYYQQWNYKKRNFLSYYCRSDKRIFADRILTQWDELPRDRKRVHYLGTVKGLVILPHAPEPSESWLCIYLIPHNVSRKKWYRSVPVHRITADLRKISFEKGRGPTNKIAFGFETVTPGKYWLNAVWDKAKPLNFGENTITGPPQKGDYHGTAARTITVEAAEITTGVLVDCRKQVTDAAN